MSDTLCVVCDTRPRMGRSYLCGGCFARLRAELATVQWAHEWLGAAIANATPGWKSSEIRQHTDSKPPYRVEYTDLRTEIHAKLGTWARVIGEQHFPPLAGPLDDSLAAIGTWLRARLPWVSDQEWVDAFLNDLIELRRQAYRFVPWDRRQTKLALPCPKCDLLTLSLFGGDDSASCRNRLCNHIMTALEYKKAVEEFMRKREQQQAIEAAPVVDWRPFDYKNKEATRPPHDSLVWIVELYEHGVTLGYFDGHTFLTHWGSDDCHVSHWAEISYPSMPEAASAVEPGGAAA